MASTCAGHWSTSTTSSPALVRSAATQLPFAPVPRTAIFLSIVFHPLMIFTRLIGADAAAPYVTPRMSRLDEASEPWFDLINFRHVRDTKRQPRNGRNR